MYIRFCRELEEIKRHKINFINLNSHEEFSVYVLNMNKDRVIKRSRSGMEDNNSMRWQVEMKKGGGCLGFKTGEVQCRRESVARECRKIQPRLNAGAHLRQ
ncbi:hypothetical protein J3R30DRAFT_3403844 [Lentinula aciculospora]|uniref:Uncharacterized protein n=1 Tax=Lentinula aciculospora TaxID=153920 RepID=A0A9W9DPP1_9AGAR|nr:hypothetical protein J3R30DRAFT_3403844 [Lentinula aciculospora]